MDCAKTHERIKHYRTKATYKRIDINSLVKRNALVLDAGCGRGFLLNELGSVPKENKIGIDCYNYEKIHDPIVHNEKPDFIFLVGDLRQMPLKPKSFDFIICHHVIEHLNGVDGAALLNTFSLLLKKGGVVLVKTPNAKNITRQAKVFLKKLCLHKPLVKILRLEEQKTEEQKKFYAQYPRILNHLHEYSLPELISLMQRSLRVESAGAIAMEWHAVGKPLAFLSMFLPWGFIEFTLDSIDSLFDYIWLWRFKSAIYAVGMKE